MTTNAARFEDRPEGFADPVAYVHGFAVDADGNESHAEPDEATGWSAYVMWHDQRGPYYPHTTTDESDFPTRCAALAFAQEAARHHGVAEVREY